MGSAGRNDRTETRMSADPVDPVGASLPGAALRAQELVAKSDAQMLLPVDKVQRVEVERLQYDLANLVRELLAGAALEAGPSGDSPNSLQPQLAALRERGGRRVNMPGGEAGPQGDTQRQEWERTAWKAGAASQFALSKKAIERLEAEIVALKSCGEAGPSHRDSIFQR